MNFQPLTYEIIGSSQAEATNASVVQVSSGPINAKIPSSLIFVIILLSMK